MLHIICNGKPVQLPDGIGLQDAANQLQPTASVTIRNGFQTSENCILADGDSITLIEKAEKAYDAKKAAEMEQKLKSNRFTLQDYYDQLVQLKSMGSMDEILAQMPGGANLKGVKVDEKAMARTEAIILSMTPRERENPNIIGASRKKRIAAGSGVKVEDVNRLLKSFDQMQKLIKQFSGPGAGKKMKRMKGMAGFRGGFPGF